jgi:hypothetical protein
MPGLRGVAMRVLPGFDGFSLTTDWASLSAWRFSQSSLFLQHDYKTSWPPSNRLTFIVIAFPGLTNYENVGNKLDTSWFRESMAKTVH